MNNYRLLIMLLCVTLCAEVSAISSSRTIPLHSSLSGLTQCDVVLSIDEMFHLADENSKQLRPLVNSQHEAEQNVSVARSQRLPEINVDVSFSYLGNGFITDRNFTHFELAPMPHYGNNFAIEASQVIYAGGAIEHAIDMAELQCDMARLQVDEKRSAIHFLLVGFYLELYKCRNLSLVLEENINRTREVLKEMQVREDEGIVLHNDITRYELLLSNLELSLTQINNTLSILNRNLTTSLGLDESIVILPDTTILHRSIPGSRCEHWINDAKENSLSLKMAETGVKMSLKSEDIIRAERLPHIALYAGYKMDGPITIEVPPINKNFNYWFVGVGVNYKISSLFKTNKRLSRSRVATRKALEEYAAIEEKLTLEINADYVRYLEAFEELKTQYKSVELATLNYDVTANRYRNDMAIITDMLDASNAKLDAEQKLVNAQINIIYYYYKLLYTSGIL